jgi:hypothetical protein
MKPLLAACAVAVLASLPASAQSPAAQRFHLSLGYDGRLLVKVLDIQVDQTASPTGFGASARLKSSGVLALFRKIDVRTSAQGRVVHGQARPSVFHHQNIDGRGNRKVDVTWTGSDVTTVAQPSFKGKMGEPPATRGQRLEAIDPLTASMRIALGDGQGDFCRGTMKVFDGKARYDLDFLNRQAARPNAREKRLGLVNPVHCTVRFREVAGFKKKPPAEQNQGLKHPVVMGFAEAGAGGPWVISFLDAETPLGHATIELERLKVSGTAPN